MPIYEYLCEECGALLEKIQKFSDAPLTHCEKCNGKVNKVLSQSSFVLKGSGWYMTDYSKKNSAPAKSDKTETKPDTETKSECKADTGCGSSACSTNTD